jgi:hypothetical protein
MPVTQVPCPSCGVILKPTRPVEPGQRLKCPRCATAFQVAAPAPAVQEPAPAEGGTAPAGEKSRTGLIVLLAGLGVAGLCLCCGGATGVGLYFSWRTGKEPPQAARLPAPAGPGSQAPPPAGAPAPAAPAPAAVDSREAVPRDQAHLMTELANLLATVQDQASADKARARLKDDIGPRIQDLVKRNKAGGQVSVDWQQEMARKYGAETSASTFKVLAEVRRLQNVPGGPAVVQELKDDSHDWRTLELILP